MNFMGRYVFVASGKQGYEAVAVTEHDEPPAVIGSDFQKMAYPDNYKKHIENHRALKEAQHHPGAEVLDRAGARRISLRRHGQRRASHLRYCQHRQQRYFGAHGDGAGLAAWAAILPADKVRDGGRDSDYARRRSAALAFARKTKNRPST